MTARQANLLAALVLTVDDRLQHAVADEAGHGGQAPAALTILAQQDGLSLENLRAQLGLSQPAIVRLVDALVADGSAQRRPGPDRRTRTLVLTRTGRRRANRVLAARRAVADLALEPLSAAERSDLEGLLERMLATLIAAGAEPAVADVTCRLCDLAACPQRSCPVAVALAEDYGV